MSNVVYFIKNTVYLSNFHSSAAFPVVHAENKTSAEVTSVTVDVINETTTVTDYFAPTSKTCMKSVLFSY